jgi:predicted DNA-binding transcriptional regulator AlpA
MAFNFLKAFMQPLNDSNATHSLIALLPPTAFADTIVRKMHAGSIVGLSTTRIETLVREGKFPAPFKLCEGGRASGWLRSTLDSYNAARATAATSRLCQHGKATK